LEREFSEHCHRLFQGVLGDGLGDGGRGPLFIDEEEGGVFWGEEAGGGQGRSILFVFFLLLDDGGEEFHCGGQVMALSGFLPGGEIIRSRVLGFWVELCLGFVIRHGGSPELGKGAFAVFWGGGFGEGVLGWGESGDHAADEQFCAVIVEAFEEGARNIGVIQIQERAVFEGG